MYDSNTSGLRQAGRIEGHHAESRRDSAKDTEKYRYRFSIMPHFDPMSSNINS
jgi:hypothetical protein